MAPPSPSLAGNGAAGLCTSGGSKTRMQQQLQEESAQTPAAGQTVNSASVTPQQQQLQDQYKYIKYVSMRMWDWWCHPVLFSSCQIAGRSDVVIQR